MKKALLSLVFFSVIPAFAFDPILLQCLVTGKKIYPGEKAQNFSETIEIDVSAVVNQIIFELNGPTLYGLYLGRSFTNQDGTKVTSTNVDSSNEWKFTEETDHLNGRSTFESGRIDRRTGSISYEKIFTVSAKHTVSILASGTCSKQPNVKKF